MEEQINLISTFADFKESKSIDRETLMHILEDVFVSALTKKYGANSEFNVIVNVDRGDLEIQHSLKVVEDDMVTDPANQISLSDAIKIEPDFEVGEEVIEQIQLSDFQRREILALRQNLSNKIMEHEKDVIFHKYEPRKGELITGEVSQVWKKEILVIDDDRVEMVLPKSEQIPTDYYKKGDSIMAVITSVDVVNGSPRILLSRTSPRFLECLMERAIPEIEEGVIMIRDIVRVPGERAKVLVETYDDRIDPVGACVGVKGSRIHDTVRELRNENIDIINWTTNPILFFTRALSPAKITNIVLSSDNTMANVYMENDQISLAIGKGGYNIKLAGKLTGYEIDVYRNSEANNAEEDVDLQEFSDEIDQWVIDSLVKMGCDTAKNVLSYTPEEVASRADLEIETVKEVFHILKAEFEQDAE